MRSTKFILMMAVVGLTACTRSGSSNPPIQQTPQVEPTPIQTSDQRTPPRSRSELDRHSGHSATEDQTPDQTPDQTADPAADHRRNRRTAPANDGGPQVTAPSASDDSDGPRVVKYDPSGLTPKQIFDQDRSEGQASLGAPSNVSNDGTELFYSGSGKDDLRDQLQDIVDTQTRADRVELDKAFAARVNNAMFDVDWSSRTGTIRLNINRRQYTLRSTLTSKLLMHMGDLRHGQKVSIEAACMDLQGGCDTVYAKVMDATSGKVRTAHVLIRTTRSTLFTKADGFAIAQNIEFDQLLRILVNTDTQSGQPGALERLTMRTSETINGPSNFVVQMGIYTERGSHETLNFMGPLVKPADDDSQFSARSQVLAGSSPLTNAISNVDLIRNSGRGSITLAITVRKTTPEASEDTIEATVARIHKPTKQLLTN